MNKMEGYFNTVWLKGYKDLFVNSYKHFFTDYISMLYSYSD